MIELSRLSLGYDEKPILQDISLIIDSHLNILGANGSGKSTLAKAFCGLLDYTGKIIIDTKNLKAYEAKERAKKIAYIPTKLEFYDEFITLAEFVLQGRFAHKESFLDYSDKDRSIASANLELFGLAHLKEQTLSSLSSGETALALIAQALTQESEIIIFDEPTANLDPKNSKIIAEHIKNLKQTHQTVLITHDLHLAHYIDSPVLFLQEKKAHYFTENFFEDDNLSSLYDVKIQSLAVQYA
ncbi:ABC transporter ATP-binding protein [Sulfurimonas paralvinellae]|uniref:ABC transporter ATP-binding protein n=1 Tax=Sulfurimonas paralvinellae TaxID=317658 RepID=A0A7M1B7T5_9BACT|nr:ABC transporter ATP-binding protein [Sulfurimonas paralvinellae]QOP44848.1 ABC transporter ATP-binding protein [Sulfurimonas paralvinellae]